MTTIRNADTRDNNKKNWESYIRNGTLSSFSTQSSILVSTLGFYIFLFEGRIDAEHNKLATGRRL